MSICNHILEPGQINSKFNKRGGGIYLELCRIMNCEIYKLFEKQNILEVLCVT